MYLNSLVQNTIQFKIKDLQSTLQYHIFGAIVLLINSLCCSRLKLKVAKLIGTNSIKIFKIEGKPNQNED
jgi:hypothetical protein